MTFDPILLLAMWAAGLAAAAAAVAWWDIVGRAYFWVVGATAVVIPSSALFAVSAVAFLSVAAGRDGWGSAIAGSLALGGITSEMLLGHWFLVDPRLPRWALRRLDIAGGAGVVGEVVIAASRGTLRAPTDLFGFAYLALAVTTILLAVGVWFSLREKGYEGVMAATGLSYLATLTVLAVAFLGRVPVEEFLGLA